MRSSEIAEGIAILSEGERAFFVGAEEFFGREGLREEELGVVSVEERVWSGLVQPHVREEAQRRVRFLRREEAEKCECCGKK